MKAELSNTLDITRKHINGNSCRQERSRIGQFLTPAKIAQFMASLFKQDREHVRILDSGAGVGVLFAACIEMLLLRKQRPLSIKVVAYENDKSVLPHLNETMLRCKSICKEADIPFLGEIRTEDFLTSAIAQTEDGLFAVQCERFTHAILNPPYKKISEQSATRRLLDAAGVEVSNLYAAFVWLSAQMLESTGELVAITPRSFCNGPYFRRFRIALLDMMSLQHIHSFKSRKKAFGDDNVLQENVIYYAIRGERKPDCLIISSSEAMDFEKATERSVPYEHVILPGDRDAFIYLIMSNGDDRIMEQMRNFATSLDELDLDVSTGRVVDFRAEDHLRFLPEHGTAPLIYPCHFEDGFVNWPAKSGKKSNAIIITERTEDLLIDNRYYVLTKRFSSKEERRRIVAAVYDPHKIKTSLVGFENHLNYFHSRGKELSANMANGLALYLNSSLCDQYFRLFSGHTQVNATDLRKMRYPTRQQLLQLGAHIKHRMPDQETVDLLLKKICKNDC
ncbi:MAG: Eco57I restriction-modification methylase domain-containing protein [Candidatus Schekmanbacteria bacterium]|nr:Eco57I restriction-modification methylase domain-containing protein [Candidatus Schekmanbacteria bacterium]